MPTELQIREQLAETVDQYVTLTNQLKIDQPIPDKQANKIDVLKQRIDALECQLGGSEPQSPLPPFTAREQAKMNNASTIELNDHGFNDVPDFLGTVMTSTMSRQLDNRLTDLTLMNQAGTDEMMIASDPYGGFLVPPMFSNQLLTRAAEVDPTNPRIVPMGNGTVCIPARTDHNHTESVTGGFRVYWKPETQPAADSRGELEQVELNAKTILGGTHVTEELLQDSPQSIFTLLSDSFGDEFGSEMLAAKIDGNGAGKPEGILNAPSRITIAKEGSQPAATINGQNVIKMRSRVWNYGEAMWMANPDCYEALVGAHIAGTNTDTFIFVPGNGTDVPDTLLGRPIFFNSYMNPLGQEGDIACVNWREYLWGERGTGGSDQTIAIRFMEFERSFRFWRRLDGRTWWRVPLTPRKSPTHTLSPIVTLQERA